MLPLIADAQTTGLKRLVIQSAPFTTKWLTKPKRVNQQLSMDLINRCESSRSRAILDRSIFGARMDFWGVRRLMQRLIRDTVEAVCADMYDGYINAAKEVFGKKVRIVADRFHVAKLYRKGVDELRKQELKRLKKGLPQEDYAQLKGAMWVLRKDTAELSQQELDTLACLFICSPLLKLAYEECNELTAIFDAPFSQREAIKEIKKWKKRIEKSALTCFDDFLTTLDRRMPEISNYFKGRFNSGFVEGLNNKIKVIKRRCYGILNVEHLFQHIHLDLAGYSALS
jgi:transposase